MVTKTHLLCNECQKIERVSTKTANKFKGKSYNGEYTNRENCSWYENNLKIVLGTLACGTGPSDMKTLMMFMDIPVPKSFAYGTFTKLENLVGVSLRKIAGESMQEGLEEEIQIETDMPYKEWIKTNNKVKLICSYGMGWNKRSSGN